MKTSNAIIAVVLIALCLVGALFFGSRILSSDDAYEKYMAQGNAWFEDGLYQRAIGQYELALEENPNEELYVKINTAYSLRYAEAAAETLEDYMDFLQDAVDAFPANESLVESYVAVYYTEEEYEDIYACLINAVKNGYNTEAVQEKLRQVKYLFKVRRSTFYGVTQSEDAMYAVVRENGSIAYSAASGFLLNQNYDYVGLPSADGVVVVTGQDSRIVNSDGLVMGIFDTIITEAGVFADGLVPACCNGVYAYYDEFADKQFGEYEFAGKFQDGVAAVKTGGKWLLVDTKGNTVHEFHGQIILDYAGRFMLNKRILVKTAENEYSVYNEKYELVARIECSDADICTEDGLIAVCQNGLWGFANTAGEMVIQPQYQQARSFSNGVAAVCKDGLWGFIDAGGNLVIDYQFYEVGYMDVTGTCAVCIEIPKPEEGSEELDLRETWKLISLELGITED